MARKGGKRGGDKQVAPDTVAPADAPALPAAKKTGAPLGNKNAAKYTPEIARQICEWIAETKTLDQCVDLLDAAGNRVCRSTIFNWLAAHKEFAQLYAEAHRLQADKDADDMRNIVRRVIGPIKKGETALDPTSARVALGGLQWIAERRNPKKYGAKVEVDTPEDGTLAKGLSAVTQAVLAAITPDDGGKDGA